MTGEVAAVDAVDRVDEADEAEDTEGTFLLADELFDASIDPNEWTCRAPDFTTGGKSADGVEIDDDFSFTDPKLIGFPVTKDKLSIIQG